MLRLRPSNVYGYDLLYTTEIMIFATQWDYDHHQE